MSEDLAQKAVAAALAGDWEEAIKLNKKLLSQDHKDTEALNRLARAYAETGRLKAAKDTAKKVLKIDQFNSIAQKALNKWRGLKKGGDDTQPATLPQAFLEEPGKTKIISLLYLGAQKTLAGLDAGDELELNTHKHRVSITTKSGKYVGRLPDDLSARLRQFVKRGNEYQVLIKSIEPEKVKVFIRETKRVPEFSDTPSFSTEKIEYISFTSPELVHKKDIEVVGDEEE